MDSSERTRHWLNLAVAAMWTIILPTCYAKSRKKYTCYSMQSGSWLKELCFSPYMIAVGIYMMSNAVQMVLFFVPAVRNYIEVSNCHICTILSWWTKVGFQLSNWLFLVHFLLMLRNCCIGSSHALVQSHNLWHHWIQSFQFGAVDKGTSSVLIFGGYR